MKRGRVYIIAEAGVNHNGSVKLAKKLIDEAKKAGADAVKFQTFRAKDLVTASTPKAAYQMDDWRCGTTQQAMLKRLELDWNSHKELYRHAKARRIEFLSTPFDVQCLDFLVKLGIKRIKLSSGDLTNGPLLLAAARTKRPVILSTGMANLEEITDALAILAFGYCRPRSEMPVLAKARRLYQREGTKSLLSRKVSLLHCTTEYPAPFTELNLRAMDVMRKRFNCIIGFSDHSEGTVAAIAAVARGARVIEKHFTLNKDMPGPDHRASLAPDEFSAMVRGIRQVEDALGDERKTPSKSEIKNIPVARKSIVASHPIAKGEIFTVKNLTSKRAGKGISPMKYWDILGRRSKRNFLKDQKVTV